MVTLNAGGRRELPEDTRQSLPRPRRDLAGQILTGSGKRECHHLGVIRLAAPGYVTGGGQPAGEPGNYRCLQYGARGIWTDRVRQGSARTASIRTCRRVTGAVKDFDTSPCHARQDARGRLQDLYRLGRQPREDRARSWGRLHGGELYYATLVIGKEGHPPS